MSNSVYKQLKTININNGGNQKDIYFISPEQSRGIIYRNDGRLWSNHRRTELGDAPYETDTREKKGDLGVHDLPYESRTLCEIKGLHAKQSKGDLRYYVSRNVAVPFNGVNFPNKKVGDTQLGVYVDPMEVPRPDWIYNNEKGINKNNYSFINDSTKFRVELMAKQQRKYNQERGDVFWNMDK